MAQIHIAGHSRYEKYILDTHDHPVIDPVWQLYARAIERCGPTPTLLEWDEHIPSFDEVHAEAKKAERYLKQSCRVELDGGCTMNLETLQREMAAAVMQPLTMEENMGAQAGDGRAMTAVAESFIAPNSRLSAFERLEIYNRQYWYRVLDALIEDFRALRAVVGGSAFQAMSIAYLTAHPSRSFTMRNLGSKLPEWLAANRQFTGRRHRLAMDVARIEWAFVEAWDGADYPPLTIDQIGTLDGGSRLALQPHLRLIALDYPADDLVLGSS